MTVPIHSFRNLRHSTLSLILLVAFAGIAGCANDNSSGGMSSPPDWVVVPSGGQHAKSATRDYLANGGSTPCTECHGADLSGGTSKVSCFGNPAGCHHGPVSGLSLIHISEPTRLRRISYAVFCLKKKK